MLNGGNMKSIDNLLLDYVENTFGSEENFGLAYWYKENKQWAAAVSFFLRVANYAEDEHEQYDALINVAYCFMQLPDRVATVKTLLLHCIGLNATRPEAYYLLAYLCSSNKWYVEGYTWASLGLQLCSFTLEHVKDVGYNGKYNLMFEKGHCADWCDRVEEAKEIMLSLADVKDMDINTMWAVNRNLRYAGTIGNVVEKHNMYTSEDYERLRYKFDGAEKIERNWSEVYQDMFALTMNDGRENCRYLEIGANDPTHYSNSFLLEKFGWDGISIEIKEEEVAKWKGVRNNKILNKDALTIDYASLLKEKVYHYLQVDCEPPETSFNILLLIPFDTVTFASITFEHDYCEKYEDKYRTLSRKFLKAYGYQLVTPDVSKVGVCAPFEDWYVHPSLVDPKLAKIFTRGPGGTDVKKLFLS